LIPIAITFWISPHFAFKFGDSSSPSFFLQAMKAFSNTINLIFNIM
jgi:hypothetical protein